MKFGRINDRLAVGGAPGGLYDVRAWASRGITNVMSLRSPKRDPRDVTDEMGWAQQAGLEFRSNPRGTDEPKTPDWFEATWRYALAVLARPQAKLLVHCREGAHRGPASCYFVLRALGSSRADAWGAVLKAAPDAETDYLKDAEDALAALGYANQNRRTK